MEAIVVLLAVSYGLIALIVLERTAITCGADAQEPMQDNYIR